MANKSGWIWPAGWGSGRYLSGSPVILADRWIMLVLEALDVIEGFINESR